jgi:hypothetical protein
MTKTDVDWQMVEQQLPEGWEALAKQVGLIRQRPPHLGAKCTSIREVLRLVLHHAGMGRSLRATVAVAAATQVLTLSAVSLHKWMRKIGPYLAALLRKMVDTAAFAPERWGGFDVIAADASTVQRPGSKGTTARVHYALRLADLTSRHIDVTDEHGGETARRFIAEPGELWILDRGYANPPSVKAIVDRGAHVLVRYNRGTLPVYDKRGQRLDVAQLLRNTKERGVAHQVRATVRVGDDRIEGRLCWLHLPADKAEQARARARREAEGDENEETIEAAEYVVLFTNVLHGLTAAMLLDLYRARWQIELEFKRSKSIRDLDRLPNFLPDTIYSWICAKLLLQTIATKIASSAVAFPPGEPCARFDLLPAHKVQAQPPAWRRRAVVRRHSRVERHPRGPAACPAA